MSPIPVTRRSGSNSDFEWLNVSFKENKPNGVIRTLAISTAAFERMKENSIVFGGLIFGKVDGVFRGGTVFHEKLLILFIRKVRP